MEELESLRSSCGFRTAGHDLAVLSRSRSAEGLATGTGTAASDSLGGTGDRQAGSFESSRVTGRPEGQETPAPWGYGDAFDPSAVPPRLSEVVSRIQQCGSFPLGTRESYLDRPSMLSFLLPMSRVMQPMLIRE